MPGPSKLPFQVQQQHNGITQIYITELHLEVQKHGLHPLLHFLLFSRDNPFPPKNIGKCKTSERSFQIKIHHAQIITLRLIQVKNEKAHIITLELIRQKGTQEHKIFISTIFQQIMFLMYCFTRSLYAKTFFSNIGGLL